MQSSWRLREQKRKDEAEAAARRRAVEKNEISFPSLGNTGWGVAEVKTESEAAHRWSTGEVVRSRIIPTETTPSSGAGSSSNRSVSSSGVGIHSKITAAVRRTTQSSTRQYDCDYDEDDHCRTGADLDEWTEVSKTKSKLTMVAKRPAARDDYYDDEDDDDYLEMNS